MTANDIRTKLKAARFQPFVVVMDNGDRYEVRHPEAALVSTTTMVIFGPPKRGSDIPEGGIVAICSLPNISAIEPLASRAA